MFFNSIDFYNYTQIENCSLTQEQFSIFIPKFHVKFNFPAKEKKRIIQTSDLLFQFFNARPKIRVVKKFGKLSSFTLSVSPNFNSIFRVFRIVHSIRASSRKKLITFKFKRSGFTYLVLRDFVTLFPFRIKTYDFHDWRYNFVLFADSKSSTEFKKFYTINFYFNFFNFF